jgi:SAM-dependent methyltransferase
MTTAPAPLFQKYAAVYDLLYHDKDYGAEAAYVAKIIRDGSPRASTILELGSGTGRHGRILASLGFDVLGIDRSEAMVACASPVGHSESGGTFRSQVGDIRALRLGREFDAVIALFHVVSYQTSDQDLKQLFSTAAMHLASGGIFVFDVWHGPAVLAQRPSVRVKFASNDEYEIKRTARPVMDEASRTVKIAFDVACTDLRSGERFEIAEEHVMRYLYPAEIEGFAMEAGFRLVHSEEYLSGANPSPSTWGVAYILQK